MQNRAVAIPIHHSVFFHGLFAGEFADVYRGTMKTSDGNIVVAIKVLKVRRVPPPPALPPDS